MPYQKFLGVLFKKPHEFLGRGGTAFCFVTGSCAPSLNVYKNCLDSLMHSKNVL